MNRSSEIIKYLSETSDSEVVIIAPMAPPVDRTHQGLRVAIHQILDAADVSDTLTALHSRATGVDSPSLAVSGTFSFGLRDVGRFRVNYMTQRGSKVISITRIPVTIPDLDQVVVDDQQKTRLSDLSRNANGGICLYGSSVQKLGLVVYALLHQINHSQRKVIYCLERALTNLMHHENSIVIQSELGVDARSLQGGVDVGQVFSPDIMFVGDVRTPEEIAMVTRVMETGVFVIFTVTAVNLDVLRERINACNPATLSAMRSLLLSTIGVTVTEANRFELTFNDIFQSA